MCKNGRIWRWVNYNSMGWPYGWALNFNCNNYKLLVRRSSKSPDLEGDLSNFYIIMRISRFYMKISRFIKKTRHLYSTRMKEQYGKVAVVGDEIRFFLFFVREHLSLIIVSKCITEDFLMLIVSCCWLFFHLEKFPQKNRKISLFLGPSTWKLWLWLC